MEWIYNGDKYYTIQHNNTIPNNKNLVIGEDYRYLVYNKKWDKCYWLCCLGLHGNGTKYKVFIEDIYNPNTCVWCEAKNIEFVIRK